MLIVGLARIGIAGRLRALDLLAERLRPFAPREQAARLQRDRHRKRLRFPRFAKHRTLAVARNAAHRIEGEPGRRRRDGGHAASR